MPNDPAEAKAGYYWARTRWFQHHEWHVSGWQIMERTESGLWYATGNESESEAFEVFEIGDMLAPPPVDDACFDRGTGLRRAYGTPGTFPAENVVREDAEPLTGLAKAYGVEGTLDMTIFDPSTQQYIEVPDQPRRIPIPFLNREIGAGDALRSLTEAAGVQPCTPCEERRKKMNRHFVLSPWGT